MLAFRDFAPRKETPAGWFTVGTWEPFEAALAEANDWIAREGIDIINVETLLVPHQQASSEDPAWHFLAHRGVPVFRQVIRVWYRPRRPPREPGPTGERVMRREGIISGAGDEPREDSAEPLWPAG